MASYPCQSGRLSNVGHGLRGLCIHQPCRLLVAACLAVLTCQLELAVGNPPIRLLSENAFAPCAFEAGNAADTTDDVVAGQVVCSEAASRAFGRSLPILVAGPGHLVTRLRIDATPRVKSCPPNAFAEAGSSLREIRVKGAQLEDFDPDCFAGTVGAANHLQTIVLENAFEPVSDKTTSPSSGLALRLFTAKGAFRSLSRLQRLELVNIDLSDGLPEWALLGSDGVGSSLINLRLAGNQLKSIDKYAFHQSASALSLQHLAIERQPNGILLMRNARAWARPLVALTSLSLDECRLHRKNREFGLNLGHTVNQRLEQLSLQGCSLTDVVTVDSDKDNKKGSGLNLFKIGTQLRHLALGRNYFGPKSKFLGVRRFTRLTQLQININNHDIGQLPDWLSDGSALPFLAELNVESSGVRMLPQGSLPEQLRILRLSWNPLDEVSPQWTSRGSQLEELHLNGIRLASVQVGSERADWTQAFEPLSSTLRLLSLADCQLSGAALQLHPGADAVSEQLLLGLGQLQRLESLLLVRNPLQWIPRGAFASLTELTTLVLHSTELTSINEVSSATQVSALSRRVKRASDTLPRHRRLVHLDLRHNQLTTLNRCAQALGFSTPLEDLLPDRPVWVSDTDIDDDANSVAWQGGLSLTGNPLVCDCRLAWLRATVQRMTLQMTVDANGRGSTAAPFGYGVYLREALDFQCQGANRLTNQQFLSISVAELYSIDHEHCARFPGIYGTSQTPPEDCLQDKLPTVLRPERQLPQLPPIRPLHPADFDPAAKTVWINASLPLLLQAWQAASTRSLSSADQIMMAEKAVVFNDAQHITQRNVSHDGAHLQPPVITDTANSFDVVFWQSGYPKTALHLPQVHSPPKPVNKASNDIASYKFAVSPVRDHTAYTICLCRLAPSLAKKVAACQIMQPFHVDSGTVNGGQQISIAGYSISLIKLLMLIAGGVAFCCVVGLCFILICYGLCGRRQNGEKADLATVAMRRSDYSAAHIEHAETLPKILQCFGCCRRRRPSSTNINRGPYSWERHNSTGGFNNRESHEHQLFSDRQLALTVLSTSKPSRSFDLPLPPPPSVPPLPPRHNARRDSASGDHAVIAVQESNTAQFTNLRVGEPPRSHSVAELTLLMRDRPTDSAGEVERLSGKEAGQLPKVANPQVKPQGGLRWLKSTLTKKKLKQLETDRNRFAPPQVQATWMPGMEPRRPSVSGSQTRLAWQSVPDLPKPFWVMSREDQLAASGVDLNQLEQPLEANGNRLRAGDDTYLPMAPDPRLSGETLPSETTGATTVRRPGNSHIRHPSKSAEMSPGNSGHSSRAQDQDSYSRCDPESILFERPPTAPKPSLRPLTFPSAGGYIVKPDTANNPRTHLHGDHLFRGEELPPPPPPPPLFSVTQLPDVLNTKPPFAGGRSVMR